MKKVIIYVSIILIIIALVIGMIIIYYTNNNQKNEEEFNIEYEQEGGAEYTSKELENFNLRIIGIDNDILNKIDEKELLNNIKEYLYKKGLIKVNEAQCIEHSVNQNHLIIKFKLNDEETTRLIVKINLDNNSYEFF